jgi:predicted oxidoreductase
MTSKLKPAKVLTGTNGAKMVQDFDGMWQVYSPMGQFIGSRDSRDGARTRLEYAELFDINEEAFWKAIGYVNYTACERALLNYFGDQGHV